jgi:23S rRNA (pseudouridine1915-N3)-methyltransferase
VKLAIAAVGRLRDGPERRLVEDYLARAAVAGRPPGLGPATVAEVDERKARDPDAQAERLLALVPPGAAAIALDERGRALSSPAFAGLLAELRDGGSPAAAFLIGGADGHGGAVRARADRVISLGPMVWPHMLARVMLSEQIYRAVSILAGTPYHRD